jgi:hypothetical protein
MTSLLANPHCSAISLSLKDVSSSLRRTEQLREYFEVRFRAEKYGVPYFLAESERSKATHGMRPQEQERGTRARI